MSDQGKVASIFNPNIEKEEVVESLEETINKFATPDFSNLKVAQSTNVSSTNVARPDLPKIVLPDFKDLIPDFKF